MTIDRAKAMDRALGIAREAAAGIACIYAGAFEVEYKIDGTSAAWPRGGPHQGHDPVTRADREANDLICAELARAYPGVPIVAEESDASSYAGFSKAPCAWFVDPLDGTRDFVAKNGEFAVMIGLAEAGRSVLGVLVLPAMERAFVGAEGIGAFEVAANDARSAIRVTSRTELRGARVLVSRSRRVPEAEARIAELGLVAERCGSAGVKGALVACGEADLYVQPGNAGSLWDSCAPEAIVRAAGGQWQTASGEPFDYARERVVNERGIVTGNAALVASVVAAARW